jgi:hypothetical protein
VHQPVFAEALQSHEQPKGPDVHHNAPVDAIQRRRLLAASAARKCATAATAKCAAAAGRAAARACERVRWVQVRARGLVAGGDGGADARAAALRVLR